MTNILLIKTTGGRGGAYNDRERFGHNRDQSFGNYSKPQAEPSAVIVIKGLPSHTNEPTVLYWRCNII